MKRKTQIAIISGLLAFSFIGAAASTFAWFKAMLTIDMNENVTGESNGAYFASGTGESNDPFIINSPVHLYNLAWLQYLGYFNNNRIGAESGPTYFAIDPSLSEPLDMTGWILWSLIRFPSLSTRFRVMWICGLRVSSCRWMTYCVLVNPIFCR